MDQAKSNNYVRTCDVEDLWNTALQDSSASSSKLMVVSCMPSWCGPCKSMDTYFEELSRQFRDIVFVKVGGGPVLKRVVREMYIEGYPTYMMFENGKEVGRVLGANKGDLWRMISIHP